MPVYFAYGSNMDPAQMSERCPSSQEVGRAWLDNYRLCFPMAAKRWNGGVAGIRTSDGGRVWGALYELSDEDLLLLDGYESVADGRYRREQITTSTDDGAVQAHVYLVVEMQERDIQPSQRYLDAVLRGALHHGFPDAYVTFLKAHG